MLKRVAGEDSWSPAGASVSRPHVGASPAEDAPNLSGLGRGFNSHDPQGSASCDTDGEGFEPFCIFLRISGWAIGGCFKGGGLWRRPRRVSRRYRWNLVWPQLTGLGRSGNLARNRRGVSNRRRELVRWERRGVLAGLIGLRAQGIGVRASRLQRKWPLRGTRVGRTHSSQRTPIFRIAQFPAVQRVRRLALT